MEFPEILRQLRNDAQISQAKLAKIIGVAQSSINYWEKGERTPSIEMCRKLAAYFNVSISELLGRKNYGDRLRRLREKHGLTHAELSEKTGIPFQTLKRYETGKQNPKANDLLLIALALDESIGDLLGYGNDQLAAAVIAEHPDDVVILDENGTPHFYYEKSVEQQEYLCSLFMKLNEDGQQEAVKRVEDLTYNPNYQKKQD